MSSYCVEVHFELTSKQAETLQQFSQGFDPRSVKEVVGTVLILSSHIRQGPPKSFGTHTSLSTARTLQRFQDDRGVLQSKELQPIFAPDDGRLQLFLRVLLRV